MDCGLVVLAGVSMKDKDIVSKPKQRVTIDAIFDWTSTWVSLSLTGTMLPPDVSRQASPFIRFLSITRIGDCSAQAKNLTNFSVVLLHCISRRMVSCLA